MRRLLVAAAALALILAGTPGTAHAATTTVTYTGDLTSVFANPERGFHNRYEIVNDPAVNDYASNTIPGFNPDMLDRTFARARADGDTLIHSYVHLDKYQTTDLPQALLDNLGTGLAAIRAQGLKIVLRFAYVWDGYSAVTEPQMERHLDQLAPVLAANADVLMHLEAGFFGAWGEWHESPYTASSEESQAPVRYRLVKKLLASTPPTIPVAIRYPIFNYEMAQRTTPPAGCPLPDNCLLTTQDFDRIGFHDDCFLADSADMGTYDQNSWLGWFDVTTKKQWVYDMTTSTGGNKIVGGETCNSTGGNDAAGVNAQYELSHQHWTELNEDYAPVNIDQWKSTTVSNPSETLFTRVKRLLGYRLRLVDATFGNQATGGAAYTFSAHLVNDGYAGVIKPRPVFLVFDDGTHRYNVPLAGLDPRTWKPGAVTVPTQTVTLPDMVAGQYKLALWLPDQATGLRGNPAYSIRLADTGIWDGGKGYNVLANAVTVGACTGGCTPPPVDTAAPTTPAGLAVTGTTTSSIGLSWNPATDNVGVTGYLVFRNGTQVGTPTGTTFTDSGLPSGSSYTYTVKARDAAGNISAASAPLTAATATPPPPVGLVLDDFDGTPAYPSAAKNDLGKWTGGNCFLNGAGSGVVSGGALTLQYNNCGWFGSDVNTDLSAYGYLVVRIKGGNAADFNVSLGGTTKVFGDFVLDGGGHPVLTAAYQDIRIPMAANGISRTSPGQLAMGFWYGGNSTISIESIGYQ
ncbi:DUF4832 domain-containing protein [Paractinoplanes globisporus]|uniref:DUF4832 domain-containing protein n=1 Tax=Paractinoplanes globisporus TaxID=113565 RepID=A0ABW6W6B3_9ACTN|nr:DUF4832 domain-containing protein [Actinoplanes globisporus]